MVSGRSAGLAQGNTESRKAECGAGGGTTHELCLSVVEHLGTLVAVDAMVAALALRSVYQPVYLSPRLLTLPLVSLYPLQRPHSVPLVRSQGPHLPLVQGARA